MEKKTSGQCNAGHANEQIGYEMRKKVEILSFQTFWRHIILITATSRLFKAIKSNNFNKSIINRSNGCFFRRKLKIYVKNNVNLVLDMSKKCWVKFTVWVKRMKRENWDEITFKASNAEIARKKIDFSLNIGMFS